MQVFGQRRLLYVLSEIKSTPVLPCFEKKDKRMIEPGFVNQTNGKVVVSEMEEYRLEHGNNLLTLLVSSACDRID